MSTKLEELARATSGLSEAAYVAQYPAPCLLFQSAVGRPAPEASVDTPPDGALTKGTFDRTSTLKVTDAFPAFVASTASVPARAGGNAAVAFLEKSDRNPFGNMITIGRAPNNDVCLPLASVSKMHAYVALLGRQWRVTDQRATNGTWVDGKRLDSGASARLADGTRLAFGPDAPAQFFTPAGIFGFMALWRAGAEA